MLSRLKKTRPRHAVAAVELAFLLPFLVLLFVLAIDFARVFYFSLTLMNCARNGAVYASQNAKTATDKNGIVIACRRDASNLNLAQMNISSSTDSSVSSVEITVTYPFTMITNYPLLGKTIQLARTVKMHVSPTLTD